MVRGPFGNPETCDRDADINLNPSWQSKHLPNEYSKLRITHGVEFESI